MIKTATPNQWEQIEQLKQQTLSDLTKQLEWKDVVLPIKNIYKNMKQDCRLVFLADSPVQCFKYHLLLKIISKDSQFYSQLYKLLRSLDSQLYRLLRTQLGSQLRSQLDSQIYSQLYSQLRSQLDSQIYRLLRSQFGSQFDSRLYMCTWWKTYSAWHKAGKILGVSYPEDKFISFTEFVDHVHFIIPTSVPIVSQHPIEIHWKNQQLHNEMGPSIKYKDGWSVYSIDGVLVDQQIVETPETQTIQQIFHEQNAEVKRIRINRFGWDRFLTESRSTKLDQRENYIESTRESLWTCPQFTIEDIPIKYLRIFCPSTGKIFCLEILDIENSITKCSQAQDWLWNHKDTDKLIRGLNPTC